MDQSIYQEHGFVSRSAYLRDLAEDYGGKVFVLADLLGPSEDFDGLLTSLEDAEDEGIDCE